MCSPYYFIEIIFEFEKKVVTSQQIQILKTNE